jgi:hypothetical protein
VNSAVTTCSDERILGAVCIALGENRYVGGQNESSLNIDFALPGLTCKIGGQTVVFEGQLALEEDPYENG